VVIGDALSRENASSIDKALPSSHTIAGSGFFQRQDNARARSSADVEPSGTEHVVETFGERLVDSWEEVAVDVQ
jgi:hypothetical protein